MLKCYYNIDMTLAHNKWFLWYVPYLSDSAQFRMVLSVFSGETGI